VKGSLYCGRIYDYAKLRAEYSDILQICVMRWSPRFINLEKNKILHFRGLSPPVKLLRAYQKKAKTEENWKAFVKRMVRHLEKDNMAQQDRFTVRNMLLAGTKIIFLCHEPMDENCHRSLLPYYVLTEKELDAGVYKGELCFDETVQLKLDW